MIANRDFKIVAFKSEIFISLVDRNQKIDNSM